MQKKTFKLLFFIRKTKVLKNGEAPIYLRITINGEAVEFLIKRSVPINLWNQTKECCKGKDRVANELNHYIETVKSKILQIHREFELDGANITATNIKQKFLGNDKSVLSLIEVFKLHNEQCEQLVGVTYKLATIKKYRYTLTHIENYVKTTYKTKDIKLLDVDGRFIRNFELYLKSRCGLRLNSMMIAV